MVSKDLFQLHRQGKGMWREGKKRISPTANSSDSSELTWITKGLKSPSQWSIQLGCPLSFLKWLLLSSVPWLFFVDVFWFPATAFWINNYKFSGGSREKDAVLLVKTFKLHLGRLRLEALNQQIFNYFIYSRMTTTKKVRKEPTSEYQYSMMLAIAMWETSNLIHIRDFGVEIIKTFSQKLKNNWKSFIPFPLA